jgi:hypothetical protein
LAFGEYVSVISSNDVSYLSGQPPQEVTNVGSVVFRMDDLNPSEIYGGTWQLITGDASIRLGDGSILSDTLQGENEPLVPLQEHAHSMNHDHPSVATSSDTHDHNLNVTKSGYGSAFAPSWLSDTGYLALGMRTGSPLNRTTHDTRGGIDNDTHNHTVDLPNFVGNTAKAGSANATLNVRGKYLRINVWKRTE